MNRKLSNSVDKKYLYGGLGLVLAIALSFGVMMESSSNNMSSAESEQWQEIELKNINSGETFTVSELEKPVLVESFAVWCSTCTRQQQEMKKLHEETDFRSVSLNVDPNENEQKVREHTDQNGFDWRYAISPTEMTQELVNQYGNSIAHPPSAPVVLVCENSTRKLPNGVKPVSKLQEEIEKDC